MPTNTKQQLCIKPTGFLVGICTGKLKTPIFTDYKGRKCFHRCLSVHNRPDGYWLTARPCYDAVGTHPTGMLSCLN